MSSLPAFNKSDSSENKMHAVALNAFFNLMQKWNLTSEEERILLGKPPRSTFFKWKKDKRADLSHDELERISYLLGIYKALHILLPAEHAANAWLKKPNDAPLFYGRTALEKMLGGSIVDLADVRRYLDAQRG